MGNEIYRHMAYLMLLGFIALSPDQGNERFGALPDPLFSRRLAESLPALDNSDRLRLFRNRVSAIKIGQDRARVGVERLDLAPSD